MGCPKCQCKEISASGMCLWCGYQVNQPDASDQATGSVDPELPHFPDEPAREELPQWRQELSKRLQAIKKKREASRVHSKQSSKSTTAGNPDALPEKAVDKSEPRPRASARGTRKRTAPVRERQPETPPLPNMESSHEPSVTESAVKPDAMNELRDTFDAATSRQSLEASATRVEYPLPYTAKSGSEKRGVMLVHRSLSGLLDLMIMTACTAAFIVAADLVSGIRMRELANALHYSVLFLLVYFLYSLLFLGITNQTIGMMMMDLHVVRHDGKRPRLGRMLARSCAYLFSAACLGIGLLWALFDGAHQCLHDRMTGTRVARINSL